MSVRQRRVRRSVTAVLVLLWGAGQPAAGQEAGAARTDGSTPINHRVAWAAALGGQAQAPMRPVVAAGTVVVGTADGTLVGLSWLGAELWQVQVQAGLLAPPAVAGGRVFVVDAVAGVHSVDIDDGSLLWSAQGHGVRVTSAPLVVGDRVVVAALDGILLAREQATGRQLWLAKIPGGVEGDIATDGRLLYVTSRLGKVHAVAVDDGVTAWTADGAGRTSQGPVLADDQLIVTGPNGGVLALGLDGGRRWSHPLPGPVQAGAAVDGDVVVACDRDGTVEAVSASDGRRRWRASLASACRGAPTLAGEVVLVGTEDGVLHALDREAGAIAWQAAASAALSGPPVVDLGRAFALGTDGRLLALGAQDYATARVGAHQEAATSDPIWVGGRTWTGGVRDLVVAGAGPLPELMLWGEGCGLLWSRDGGAQWQRIDPPQGDLLGLLTDAGGLLLQAVTTQGLFSRTDQGWTRQLPPPEGATGPLRARRTGRGLLVLDAGERSWSWSGSGWAELPGEAAGARRFVTAVGTALSLQGRRLSLARQGRWLPIGDLAFDLVALDAVAADHLVAISADGGLHRSLDGGRSWARTGTSVGSGPARLVGDAALGWLVACWSSGKVMVSRDGGAHWRDADFGLPAGARLDGARITRGANGGPLLAVDLDGGTTGVFMLGEVSEHRRVEEVSFASGSAELTAASVQELRTLATQLAGGPALRARIEGHTDDVGSDEANLVLSVERARAVARVLLAQGAAPHQVEVIGFGEARPRVPNQDPDSRRANRRVELYLAALDGA